jgi:hypothetical protein
VRSDRTVEAEAVLLRDNVEIARRRQTFQAGATQLTFRDLVDRPGVARYRLELIAADDRVPENNAGTKRRARGSSRGNSAGEFQWAGGQPQSSYDCREAETFRR